MRALSQNVYADDIQNSAVIDNGDRMKNWYEFKYFIDFFEYIYDQKRIPTEHIRALPKQMKILYETWDILYENNDNFLTLKFLLEMFEYQFANLKCKKKEAEVEYE